MRLSGMLRRRGLIALAATVLLVAAGACQSSPTPTPAPTATPTPALTAEELLANAAAELAALSTANFRFIDETQTGTKFFGTTFKEVTGVVKSPASFEMTVDVVAPGLGFAEISMVAVDEQAFIKFSTDAPWAPLPLEQVPFNFGGIGVSLSKVVLAVENATITGTESLWSGPAVRMEGTIVSDDMSDLVTTVDKGHPLEVTLWVDEAEQTLQQMRMAGRLYDDDAPETTRLLVISNVNAPVDIQLPEPAS